MKIDTNAYVLCMMIIYSLFMLRMTLCKNNPMKDHIGKSIIRGNLNISQNLNERKLKINEDITSNSNLDDFGTKSVTSSPENLGENEDVFINKSDDSFNLYDSIAFYVRNINCSSTNCLPPSLCINKSTCKCGFGWVNLLKEEQPFPEVYCNYKQKNQIIAFMLEFLPSLGHLYAGRIFYGGAKLIFCFFNVCFVVIGLYTKESSVISLVACMIGIMIIWQFVDLVNFWCNYYPDGNNVQLSHW